jgi:hypothetical protein
MGASGPSWLSMYSAGRVEDELAGHERLRRLNAAAAVLADEVVEARPTATALSVESRALEDRLQRIGRA